MSHPCWQRGLDEAHAATAQLDRKWSRLRPERAADDGSATPDVEAWWKAAQADPGAQPGDVQEVVRAFGRANTAMRKAEQSLRPWVIRHLRPRFLADGTQPRRRLLTGAAIRPDLESVSSGLPVAEHALLPFLLAARTQALVARAERAVWIPGTRGFSFAEGLASSYEAFLETRAVIDARGETPSQLRDETPDDVGAAPPHAALRWYLDRLARSLPADRSEHSRHPKIAATVARTLDLWNRREKVLIFCHWRKTGQALQRHISWALHDRLTALSCEKMRCPPRRSATTARKHRTPLRRRSARRPPPR